MTREEILQMPEYWTSQIQLSLYQAAEKFMADRHMNRSELAAYLGVSKGYVSQLLNGDYNYSISKLVDLAIKLNCVPQFQLKPIKKTSGTTIQSKPSASHHLVRAPRRHRAVLVE